MSFYSLWNLFPAVEKDEKKKDDLMKIIVVHPDGQRIPMHIPKMNCFLTLRAWLHEQFASNLLQGDDSNLVVSFLPNRKDVVFWVIDHKIILTGYDPKTCHFIDVDDSIPIHIPESKVPVSLDLPPSSPSPSERTFHYNTPQSNTLHTKLEPLKTTRRTPKKRTKLYK